MAVLHALTQCPWTFVSCAKATTVKTVVTKKSAAVLTILVFKVTLPNAIAFCGHPEK
jgi:hypothetical protein